MFGEAMKFLRTIYSIVLLTAFSNVYGGTCFRNPIDAGDCQLRAKQGDIVAQDYTGKEIFFLKILSNHFIGLIRRHNGVMLSRNTV